MINKGGRQSNKPKILWAPFPKQTRFLSCPAFELLYGGAAGGGKSDALLIAPLMGLINEGFKALILRRKYIDLERSLILRSHELYKGRGVYDGQSHRWKFANNCSIEFGHCQRESDIYNYQSSQFSFIGIEQVEQFLEHMYLYFFSRVRTTNPNIKCKVRSTANPGGIGHEWIKKRFWINQRESNKVYPIRETMTHPDGSKENFEYWRGFVPATVYDNEYIMANDREYLMRLLALPEVQRKAYLEGDWNVFEGQFFKEWDPKLHVCAPFDIPKEWIKWISFDWGYSDPTVIHWWTQDPKTKKLYVYRELSKTETIDVEIASMMQKYSENEMIDTIFYPWDLDNKNGQTGISMRQRMDDATGKKFYWKEANRDRKNGWSAVRNLLKIREDGEPMMKIFSNCSNLIRTFPMQVYDTTNSEDLDTLGDDHAVDSVRYFAASFKPISEFEEEMKSKDMRIDVGGAYLLPAMQLPTGETMPRQYVMKREPEHVFSWMTE